MKVTTDVRDSGVDLRFKVSGPASQFTADSGVDGAQAQAGEQGAMGLNVLLHGDGGQSFFDFPNQAVQGNLMGVVVLAPSENVRPPPHIPICQLLTHPQLLWGQRTGPPSGLDRADGAADAQAVADLVQEVLPNVVAFNSSNIFFTGVSGGSLTLSGFFIPAQMPKFAGTGVLLMCGALRPQVDFADGGAFLANTPIHFQSTQQELTSLQAEFPDALRAFEAAAAGAGLDNQQINALQTVDNTPNGGHCEFDEQGFVSGIQLISDNFASIMQGGNGQVNGINVQSVLTGVVGNEDLQFAAAA
jgi:hypothetical protein